jgi:hypothetical protein
MITSGLCRCVMCTGVWWFISLCVHFVVYFDSIVIINGRIAIVDFGLDCNLQVNKQLGILEICDGGIL